MANDSVVYSAALEAQSSLLAHLTRSMSTGDANRLRDNMYKGDHGQFWPALEGHIDILETATPYFWEADLCAMLEVAAPKLGVETWVLKGTLFPSAAGFMHFAVPLSLPMPTTFHEGMPRTLDMVGMGWKRVTDHEYLLATYLQTSVRRQGEVAMTVTLNTNETLATWLDSMLSMRRNPMSAVQPEDEDEHNVIMAQRLELQARYYAAALSFLNTPLLATRRGGMPDRGTRKRLEADRVLHVPEIQVIELRKRKYIGPAFEPDADESRYEAHHRFMVGWSKGGFWNKYHLRDGTVEEKWILPFMKRANRTDLPFMSPKAQVNAVIR